MTQPDHAALGRLAEKFAQLPDPREQRQPQHPLGELLVIALCSMLNGGRGFNDMEDYGEWPRRVAAHLPAAACGHPRPRHLQPRVCRPRQPPSEGGAINPNYLAALLAHFAR